MKFYDVFSPRGKDLLSRAIAYCKIIGEVMIMRLSLFVVNGIRKYESTRMKYLFREISLLG